ncbi:hypothetical protein ACWWJF_20520 [Symbiopectobacterium sp. Eva_TO]
MKIIIRIFVIMVITSNFMRPVCAQLIRDSGLEPMFKTRFCNIDVSPRILDYGDITRAMLENDSTISKRATVNVNCDKERSGDIELKFSFGNGASYWAKTPSVNIKLDKLTLDGDSTSTKVIMDGGFPNLFNMKEDTDIWQHNHLLKANNKFLNLSAEITVTLDLSSMRDIREIAQLEENVTFRFIEDYF